MSLLRVAALQMNSGTAPGPNLETLERLAHEAARRGATYALSPEVTIAFAENRAGLAAVARPFENNPDIAQCARIARETRLWLHVGSLAVALPDGRFANRSVLFGPDGVIAASYDKIHLFDADLPGVRAYRESETYAGGDAAVVVEAAGVRLGLSICYDVRFAPLYRTLADAGAQMIVVPAAFTVPTGEAHWEVLLRARAIETGCFVIAAAQAGRHENGRSTWGHSMIVDPWGAIVGQLSGEGEGVLVADLDVAAVAEARSRVPALANSRPFSLSVNPASAS
ncbi:MAG: carbon-nitrogen hydrolase family protein [Devosia sp.]